MQDLRRLSLAENLIVELVPRVFYMLGKLKYLSLSGNPVSILIFRSFTSHFALTSFSSSSSSFQLNDLPPDVFKDVLVI